MKYCNIGKESLTIEKFRSSSFHRVELFCRHHLISVIKVSKYEVDVEQSDVSFISSSVEYIKSAYE
jgi:hypothetical protein